MKKAACIKFKFLLPLKLLFISVIFLAGNFSNVYAQVPDYSMGDNPYLSSEKLLDDDIMSLIRKARELYKLGIIQSAILNYQEVIELDPDNELARFELGRLALETKNWAYAIRMLSELAELRPDDVDTRIILMEIYYTYEEPLLEMKTTYELLKLKPNDTAILNRIANLYELHEMFDEQIKILEKLSKLEPVEIKHLWKLVTLYAQRKNSKLEIKTYKKLLKLQPNNSMISKRLARLYGNIGDYDQQIASYQHVLAVEKNNEAIEKALIFAYSSGIQSNNYSFDLEKAFYYVRKHRLLTPTDQKLVNISDALQIAQQPLVYFTLNNNKYDFAGRMSQSEYMTTGIFQGPVKGSNITYKGGYKLIEAPDEPNILKNYQLRNMKLARLYRGQLSWQQKFSGINFNLMAGVIKLLSGSSGLNDHKSFFVSSFFLNYYFNQISFLSAGYTRDYLTQTPQALALEMYRDQFDISINYALLPKLISLAKFQLHNFSDHNTGYMFNLDLEYQVISTLLFMKDIEKQQPIGFDDTGLQISIGMGYEYFNFKEERNIYPTALDEHIFNIYLLAEKQLFQSFNIVTEASVGKDNKDQSIWGYHLALQKQLNWRLVFSAGYESFVSPYVYNNEQFVNNESRMYLGVNLQF